ncbi:MBL fold metallo-hydrolase [Limnobacter sp.]|uniref:MBL fold metallo-hydrolase n=1 Tax=Limnobacter sp. TaxID=2003368 RepID=UPI003512AD3C
MNKKQALTLGLAFIGVGAVVAYTQRQAITYFLVERNASQRMTATLNHLDDGLHIGLCGTGSPFPDPQRSAACTIVVAGPTVMLFDAGGGAAKQIARMNLNTGQIGHVFLTHYHSDHIDGLGELMMTRWAQTLTDQPLVVHGPTGVEEVIQGFGLAYRQDTQYRVAHHTPQIMPPHLAGAQTATFDVQGESFATVFEAPNLRVESFAVDHAPVSPAVGYKITYKDRSVVISGDTKKSGNVLAAAKGADLLIHEALNPQLVGTLQTIAQKSQRTKLAAIFGDITDYHASPVDVAQTAAQAGVQAVVYTHIVPPLPLPTLKEEFLGDAPKLYSGTLRIGEDGDWISLPAGSKNINFERRWLP